MTASTPLLIAVSIALVFNSLLSLACQALQARKQQMRLSLRESGH